MSPRSHQDCLADYIRICIIPFYGGPGWTWTNNRIKHRIYSPGRYQLRCTDPYIFYKRNAPNILLERFHQAGLLLPSTRLFIPVNWFAGRIWTINRGALYNPAFRRGWTGNRGSVLIHQKTIRSVYDLLFKWWTLLILHPTNERLIYGFYTYCFRFWHRMIESNYHQRSQSPLYYHYTNPVYGIT